MKGFKTSTDHVYQCCKRPLALYVSVKNQKLMQNEGNKIWDHTLLSPNVGVNEFALTILAYSYRTCQAMNLFEPIFIVFGSQQGNCLLDKYFKTPPKYTKL